MCIYIYMSIIDSTSLLGDKNPIGENNFVTAKGGKSLIVKRIQLFNIIHHA